MSMAEKPLVSIITPSFNQSQFLESAIQSVINQDYPHTEYWVIDGGSQDGSVEIIQKYANCLTGWMSETDEGQADAINKGFQRTRGEIVGWLNSDDVYRPHAIERAVAIFQAYPEVGLVYSDVDSIDTEGEVFNRMSYDHWGLKDLMAFNILGQPGVFFRRSALDAAGYLDGSYHYLLDHHLWLRMGLLTKIYYVHDQVWAAARVHADAKNVAHAEGFGQEAYRLAEWMQQDDRFAELYAENEKNILAGAHRLNAFYLLNADQPAAALRAYGRAFVKNPSVVVKDWRRVAFALLSPLKLNALRDRYLEKRKQHFI